MSRRVLRILAPLLPLLLLVLAAGGFWLNNRETTVEVPEPVKETVPPVTIDESPPKAVVEFRHLEGARLDEGAEKPTHSAFLENLDGQRVVIAGHMTRFDSDSRFKQFVLVENAPGVNLSIPPASEVVFVEQLGSNIAPDGSYPLVAGLIAVRGIFRIYDTIPPNPGLQQGYWFAIEEAIIDPLGAPLNAN